MPTKVLSRNTWARNGCVTAALPFLPLLVGVVPVLVELGGEVAFRAPAAGVGGGLGAGGIFYSPLFLFGAFFGFRLGAFGAVSHDGFTRDI